MPTKGIHKQNRLANTGLPLLVSYRWKTGKWIILSNVYPSWSPWHLNWWRHCFKSPTVSFLWYFIQLVFGRMFTALNFSLRTKILNGKVGKVEAQCDRWVRYFPVATAQTSNHVIRDLTKTERRFREKSSGGTYSLGDRIDKAGNAFENQRYLQCRMRIFSLAWLDGIPLIVWMAKLSS